MSVPNFRKAITDHLASWGLRRFDSDAAYDQWQRETLSREELTTLATLAEARSRGGSSADIAFYDYAAKPNILPALYSQRYDYYLAIGAAVAEQIGHAKLALDVGCGIGALTTFYAKHFPGCSFVGVDRSPASLAVAQERAATMGLKNIRFEGVDVDRSPLTGPFDLIIATQALLQTEHDPGIPSQSWRTFERIRDAAMQADFERRTGLAGRLETFCSALADEGRLIVFEKTHHLARRVPFQRALAARGLTLLTPPVPIRYSLVEEVTDDGPFYVLSRTPKGAAAWDESPEDAQERVDLAALRKTQASPDQPLYENHRASAQQVWSQLPDRRILQETTKEEPDGRQFHAELGESQGLTYLYCANTFDQRQLVIVKSEQAQMLAQYYQEVLQSFGAPAA